MRRLPFLGPCVAAGLIMGLAGCSGSSAAVSSTASPAPSAHPPLATLDLKYEKPAVVGTAAEATAEGLPAGKTLELAWGTVTGGWVIEDYYHFRGKKYSETTRSLGQFPVDAGGRLRAHFVI